MDPVGVSNRQWRIAELERQLGESTAQRDRLLALHSQVAAERDQLAGKHSQVAAQHNQVVAERDQLAGKHNQVVAERDHYHALYLKTLELCRKLEQGLIGPKSERSSPDDTQLSMAVLAQMLATEPPPPGSTPSTDDEAAPEGGPAPDDKPARRKPTGRRPLPPELPRVEVEIVPEEVQLEGRNAFEVIGTETSETVERRRASLVVVRVVRPKFVRKDRERCAETEVLCAEPPESPIERGMAGPGLLADTIVRRWHDYLPLYRLESIYAREGLSLDRSTICNWHRQLSMLVGPLIVAMWKDALGSPYLCTDATGVLVQAKGKCKRGHFWVVVAPERHVLFAYTPTHDSAAIDGLLAGYRGYLVADAHAVYDHLYKDGTVVEVACWAHARRYFWKALETEPVRAREALAIINALFAVERACASAPPGKRRSARKHQSAPLVERFFAWCEAEAPRVLDDTPIARAVGYALNQRVALSRFLGDERLPLHNNISEGALRREVIGRKNWLFLGNDEAGAVNTAFVSLLSSCALHGIEPWSYLRDLFCLLPAWPVSRVLELSPAQWQKTRQQDETQLLLDAHVFRRATLDPSDSHRPLK